MAQLITNKFSSYFLTSSEEETGSILNYEQRCIVHNKLSAVAETRLNMELDTTNVSSFIQTEAYLKGQLDTLQWLLDTSDEMEGQLAKIKAQAAAEVEIE